MGEFGEFHLPVRGVQNVVALDVTVQAPWEKKDLKNRVCRKKQQFVQGLQLGEQANKVADHSESCMM